MQETQEKQIRFPGWKYAQEEEMPTHSSILAWGTPWAEKPTGLYSPRGCKESDKTEHACTGQQVLVEGGKETIRVPRGSPCLQASSWSWNSNQNLLSPTPMRDLEPQEEQYVTQLAGEALSDWNGLSGEWKPRKAAVSLYPHLCWHRAQCLLSKQVRRGARRRLSLVAAPPAEGTFTQHIPWVQWVPCHSSPIALLMKLHPFSSQWPLFSGGRHPGRVSGDRSQTRTLIPLVKNWASSGDALEAAFAMEREGQERAIMPENMRPGAAQKWTSKWRKHQLPHTALESCLQKVKF